MIHNRKPHVNGIVQLSVCSGKLCTSFSITFSMYSTVRTLVSPVAGHTYSSVRSVILSSNNFSFSLTASIGPGFVRNAIRGRGHFYNF